MKKHIVLAGGSGLIGSHLATFFTGRGDKVTILSRSKKAGDRKGVEYAAWDPATGQLDMELKGVDCIVNLTGANLAGKRWTKAYKEELISSRVDSTKLLVDKINELNGEGPALIQLSGVGYYGADSEKIHNEADPAGEDFIGHICKVWEAEALKIRNKEKLSIIRMSPVLAREDGALPKMAQPVKFGVGAALGSGRQFMPWIHIDDVVGIIAMLADQPGKHGIYNVAAPENVTNKQLTKSIARVLRRPLILPNVPEFALRLLFGELAESLTGSCEVSILRLTETGYQFKFPSLKPALEDLLKKE